MKRDAKHRELVLRSEFDSYVGKVLKGHRWVNVQADRRNKLSALPVCIVSIGW